jgi:hypothetical protein
MGNTQSATTATEASATPAIEVSATAAAEAAAGAPATIEAPKAEAPTLEMAAEEAPKIEAPTIDAPKLQVAAAVEPSTIEPATKPTPAPMSYLRRYGLLAASLAASALLGGLAGAAATGAFLREEPAPVVPAPAKEETRVLQETVARLGSELSSLKASFESAQKNAAVQINRLGERLEKAQAEPSAKLAKIFDALDRLERRPAAPPAPIPAAADTTGSVTTIEKQQSKPPVLEGWKLRDFYAGRAVIENRSGELYEVGAGSNLPGVGKVEAVKREDGRVVVVTPKGVIASAFEHRRPPYYLHYRY